MTNTRDVILNLKKVKDERGLSLDKIVSLMEQSGEYVSKTTLSRVFRKGSENETFRYEATLRPIANALLDIENIETYDNPDTKAYKALLKFKKELISELQTERNKEKLKYHKKLEAETMKFQSSLNFLKEQIALKDKRIDQLLDSNDRLLDQLLQCPCRKKGDIINE